MRLWTIISFINEETKAHKVYTLPPNHLAMVMAMRSEVMPIWFQIYILLTGLCFIWIFETLTNSLKMLLFIAFTSVGQNCKEIFWKYFEVLLQML